MTVQDRGEHRQTVPIHTVDRTTRGGQHGFRDERLHFNRQAAVSVHGERDARACYRLLRSGQEQPGRVGHLFYALAAHIEAANLVGGTEPVFHRVQHTQRGLRIAFELADHIDQMFQCARPGD